MSVPAARKAVRAAVNAALPRFAEVTDVSISAVELRSTSTAGPERHYAGILGATKDLLGGKYLGFALGPTETESFLWSMPQLFQEALRSILETWPDAVLDAGRRPSGTIHDGSGARLLSSRIDPDYVLTGAAGRVLIDAKYKDAPRAQTSDAEESVAVGTVRAKIRVSRHDLYQMIAYRQQERWAGAATVLAYPIVLDENEALPMPYQFRGIGEPVLLAFLDIGPYARTNVAEFGDILRTLMKGTFSPAGHAGGCNAPPLGEFSTST